MGVKQEIDVQSLWAKYEDIAMHFNDLLIRLRTQSLAGVAAISTVVGIFSKDGVGDVSLDWMVAQAIFGAMIGFWIAIWCLDMLYYNRLLSGAVKAVIKLEEQTKAGAAFDGEIDMSTRIKDRFRQWPRSPFNRGGGSGGVMLFYVIVFLVLVAGFFFTGARA